MNNSVNFKNPQTNEIQTVNLGLAWPAIIFNVFYLLFKKDWKWSGIFFVIDFACAWLPEEYRTVAIFGVSILIFAFYNKIKFKELSAKGWILTDESEQTYKAHEIQKTEKAKARKEQQEQASKRLRENAAKLESTSSIFENHIHCPRCRSTNVQVVGQHRKGFSAGKATAGYLLSGGIGTLVGFTGKNTKKVDMICMNCGKKFRYKGK